LRFARAGVEMDRMMRSSKRERERRGFVNMMGAVFVD